MKDYSKLLKAGNAAQLEKMNKYENSKSGWENFPFLDSFKGIRKAAIFMERMLFRGFTNSITPLTKAQVETFRLKAANIANYAHMIILRCDKVIGLNENDALSNEEVDRIPTIKNSPSMANPMEEIKFRKNIQLDIKIGAHSFYDLEDQLKQIHTTLSMYHDDCSPETLSISSGAGYSLEGSIDPSWSEESYNEALLEWSKEMRGPIGAWAKECKERRTK